MTDTESLVATPYRARSVGSRGANRTRPTSRPAGVAQSAPGSATISYKGSMSQPETFVGFARRARVAIAGSGISAKACWGWVL